MTNKKNAFDEAALQWDSNPDRLKLHQQTAEKIISLIPEKNNWRALDFGCGTGIQSFLLSPYLGNIDCIDTSEGMIEELRKKLDQPGAPKNIVPHCKLLESGTFPAESFDLLFTVLTLHHVEGTEELIKVFAEIVKPGGRIALVDLDKEDGSFHKKTLPVYIIAVLNGNTLESCCRNMDLRLFIQVLWRVAKKKRKTGLFVLIHCF